VARSAEVSRLGFRKGAEGSAESEGQITRGGGRGGGGGGEGTWTRVDGVEMGECKGNVEETKSEHGGGEVHGREKRHSEGDCGVNNGEQRVKERVGARWRTCIATTTLGNASGSSGCLRKSKSM